MLSLSGLSFLLLPLLPLPISVPPSVTYKERTIKGMQGIKVAADMRDTNRTGLGMHIERRDTGHFKKRRDI